VFDILANERAEYGDQERKTVLAFGCVPNHHHHHLLVTEEKS
jgi:hypothetical protein